MLANNRPHGGLVLDAGPLALEPLDCLPPLPPSQRPPVWLALDEVVDPQNLGAVLRSAHYLGAAGVVVCARNSAPLSSVVSKASAGALESMAVHACRSMPRFLERSAANGWLALGASTERAAVPVTALPRSAPTILVLGNEGAGLRTTVRRACVDMVRIPGALDSANDDSGDATLAIQGDDHDDTAGVDEDDEDKDADDSTYELDSGGNSGTLGAGAVDSLNVSVAAGILLHELLNRAPAPEAMAETGAVAELMHSPGLVPQDTVSLHSGSHSAKDTEASVQMA
eukprot:SM000141S00870  [mRNA]  locus=s141:106134:106985:- [translate_table: standard]